MRLDKEKADKLAEVLKNRMGETVNIRRPSPSMPLLFIGIEDSADAEELRATLKKFDERLENITAFTIREGRIRTGVVRVPLAPGL